MLTPNQTEQLQTLVRDLANLTNTTDEDGAGEIVEAVYEFLTQIYDRFPNLDTDED